MKRILCTVLMLLCSFSIFAGCTRDESAENISDYMSESYYNMLFSGMLESTFGVDFSKPVRVQMTLTDGDSMILELYPDVAPITVRNFVYLVCYDFYAGLTFHRLVDDFMIQGGDPDGDGLGGSDNEIKGEFSANGVNNTLKHEKGVISMARTTEYNTASSQFFICTATNATVSNLDGLYAPFGKVVEGMDVLDKLAQTPVGMNYTTGEMSRPLETIRIERITIVE